MSHDAREVANFILERCDQLDRPISNLQLQKIVFFCHVWSLVKMQRPLVAQEFEAWRHGPVMPYLYKEFQHFGDGPIRGRACRLNKATGERELVEYSFDSEAEELLTQVIDSYSSLSAYQLVELSHATNGPWYETRYHETKVNPGMRIPNGSIIEYYSPQNDSILLQ